LKVYLTWIYFSW